MHTHAPVGALLLGSVQTRAAASGAEGNSDKRGREQQAVVSVLFMTRTSSLCDKSKNYYVLFKYVLFVYIS